MKETAEEMLARLAAGDTRNEVEEMLAELTKAFGKPNPETVQQVWDTMDQAAAAGGNPLIAAVAMFEDQVETLAFANEINHAAASDGIENLQTLEEAILDIQEANDALQNWIKENGMPIGVPGPLLARISNLDHACKQVAIPPRGGDD